jgi:type IV pilus biogenesis protein CpaD/CtpE
MPMRRAFVLLGALIGVAFGCASGNESLWQKIGVDYTTAEFNRDVDACTKNKKLDEECLKAKGWTPFNPDRPAPAPSPTPSRGGRY